MQLLDRSTPHVTVDFAHVAGFRIRYAYTRGAPGTVPLLVFNGLGIRYELMRPLLQAFGRAGIGVVTFDVPGIGQSPSPARPYRLPQIAAIAAGLLDLLGYDERVDVFGLSWGGSMAQEFVHRYPQRVRRLVLGVSSPGTIAVPGRFSALRRLATSGMMLTRDDVRKVAAALFGGRFRTDESLAMQYVEFLRPAKNVGILYQLLALAGWSSLLWLRSIKAPTLVLSASDDPIFPAANGRILAALIPHARLRVVDDGHLFVLTRLDEFVPFIAGFLGADDPVRYMDDAAKTKTAR